MTNKNKAKGKRFENKVADLICKYWKLSKNECWRAGSSGVRSNEYSDISFSDWNKYPYLFECKFYKDFSIEKDLFPTFSARMIQWMYQVYESYSLFIKDFENLRNKTIVSVVISRPYFTPMIVLLKNYTKSMRDHICIDKGKVNDSLLNTFLDDKIIVLSLEEYLSDNYGGS